MPTSWVRSAAALKLSVEPTAYAGTIEDVAALFSAGSLSFETAEAAYDFCHGALRQSFEEEGQATGESTGPLAINGERLAAALPRAELVDVTAQVAAVKAVKESVALEEV